MPQLPLRGCPQDASTKLAGILTRLADEHAVSKFYVGRSTSLSTTRTKHACDHMFNLYTSSEPHNAVVVEDSLNKALDGHPKRVDNVEMEEAEQAARTHHVYVALWLS
jgi:hypothetical protein